LKLAAQSPSSWYAPIRSPGRSLNRCATWPNPVEGKPNSSGRRCTYSGLDLGRQSDADFFCRLHTDAQVAHTLNERGLRTEVGAPFTLVSIRWVRHTTRLKRFEQRLKASGWITGRKMEAKLGVSRGSLGKLRTPGRMQARICKELAEWLYYPPNESQLDSIRSSLVALRGQKGRFTARGAV
jgi:hypothetical protein